MAYIDIEGPRFDTRLLIGWHDKVLPRNLLPSNCQALFLEYLMSEIWNAPAVLTGEMPNIWGTDQHYELRLEAADRGVPIVAAEPSYTPEGFRQMRSDYHRKPFSRLELLIRPGLRRLLTSCREIADQDMEIAYEGEEYRTIKRASSKHVSRVPNIGIYTSLRNFLIAERTYRFTDWRLKTMEGLGNAEKPSIAISTGLFHIEVAKALKCSQEERMSYLDSQGQILDGLVQEPNLFNIVFATKEIFPDGKPYFQAMAVNL